MDDVDPPVGLSSENLAEAVLPATDSDFGPWLLVSRQRGSTRGHGSGPRGPHVTHDAAAALSPVADMYQGSDMRSLCGGRRAAASGRPPPSLVTSPVSGVAAHSPTQYTSGNPPVISHPPTVPTVVCESQGFNPLSLSALPPTPSNQNPTPHVSPNIEPSCA